MPACSCGGGPGVAQGRWYGVRSYLHLFYEDCTRASPDGVGAEPSPARPPGTWPPVIWKVSLSTGTLLLLVGAAALGTGWLVPPRLEGIGEEDFVVLDPRAARYNQVLGACRLLGLGLCTAAAVLSTVGLLCCVLSPAGGVPPSPQDEEQQLSPILRHSSPPTVPFGASCIHSVLPARVGPPEPQPLSAQPPRGIFPPLKAQRAHLLLHQLISSSPTLHAPPIRPPSPNNPRGKGLGGSQRCGASPGALVPSYPRTAQKIAPGEEVGAR